MIFALRQAATLQDKTWRENRCAAVQWDGPDKQANRSSGISIARRNALGAIALVACVAVCVVPVTTLASDESAVASVRAYYRAQAAKETSFYTVRLTGLLNAAITKSRALKEPVRGLDFSPKIDGQDADPGYADTLALKLVRQNAQSAIVQARFVRVRSERPVVLEFSLLREKGGWKIDDIAKTSVPNPWRYAEELALGAQGK